MATGCPSIASYSTGVLDFFDSEVGFPVKCDIKESELQNYDLKAKMYIPDTRDFIEQIMYVVKNYKEALKRAKKASYRVKTNFTWAKSAKRLNDIVTEAVVS
jgi:glycosyltransferase involved in cell wall biosynthesis